MNLPLPPTDNLYKFAALSGIALILAGGSLIASALSSDKWQDLNADIRATYSDFSELVGQLPLHGSTGPRAPGSGAHDASQSIEDAQQKLKILATELDAKDKRARLMFAQSQLIAKGGIATIYIGLLLSGFGFIEWFVTYQVYANRAARHAVAVRLPGDEKEYEISRAQWLALLLCFAAVTGLLVIFYRALDVEVPVATGYVDWLDANLDGKGTIKVAPAALFGGGTKLVPALFS